MDGKAQIQPYQEPKTLGSSPSSPTKSVKLFHHLGPLFSPVRLLSDQIRASQVLMEQIT